MPLNELTVELRSGNPLNRFCTPAASLYPPSRTTVRHQSAISDEYSLVVGGVGREAAELADPEEPGVHTEPAALPVAQGEPAMSVITPSALERRYLDISRGRHIVQVPQVQHLQADLTAEGRGSMQCRCGLARE